MYFRDRIIIEHDYISRMIRNVVQIKKLQIIPDVVSLCQNLLLILLFFIPIMAMEFKNHRFENIE